MKYKLAKDLPFAKAGTLINVNGREGCVPMSLWDNIIPDVSPEFINKLISEGWITETKPREFEIKLGENSIGLYDITNKKWIFHPFPVEPTSSIKVQEIIA